MTPAGSSSSPTSYLSPKCQVRDLDNGQKGVFAIAPIAKDEIVAVWGGEVLTRAQVDQLPREYRRLVSQVEEDFFLGGFGDKDPADCINHSCDPNVGMQGQIVLVAMRDIRPGEQVCIDYAMTDGSDFDEFECFCGSPRCRQFIRGTDWRNPELWERYKGYFVPYLQKRIDRLRAEMGL